MNIRKVTFLGILLSLSIIFSIVESYIPVAIPVPGVKLGLANIVTLFVLYITDNKKDVLLIIILRIIFVAIIRTGIFSPGFFLSLGGGLLSYLAMIIGKNGKKLSIVGVSELGAAFHGAGQIIMAAIIMNTTSILFYLPVILFLSSITGILTGLIAKKVVSSFPKNMI